jgi:hypothetical protein
MMRRYHGYWHRFSQPDPYDGSYDASDPQSFNRYSYTQNDPVNFIDPLGLFPQDPRQDPPGDAWNDEGSAVDIGTVRVWSRRWWLGAGYLFGGEIATEESADGPGSGGEVAGLQGSRLPRTDSRREQNIKDCFEREKARIDAATEQFKREVGKRFVRQAVLGAARGAVMGAIGGGAAGGAFFGVGAVPGAALGAVVGGSFGAAQGVLIQGFVLEPAHRALHTHFNYNGSLRQARRYCDALY